MEPRKDYIQNLVRERGWTYREFARQAGISHAEAWRFLNGQRNGGRKLLGGLLKAFPDVDIKTLFILP